MNAIAKVEPRKAATILDRQELAKLAGEQHREVWVLKQHWFPILEARQPDAATIARFEAELKAWRQGPGLPRYRRLCDLFARCDNPAFLDEDGNPKASEITRLVGALLGSFPTQNVPQPKVFVAAMVDDIIGRRPGWMELEATCRQLRQTQKFTPAIAEVLEVLDKQTEVWNARYAAHDWASLFADDVDAELAAIKAARPAVTHTPGAVAPTVREAAPCNA